MTTVLPSREVAGPAADGSSADAPETHSPVPLERWRAAAPGALRWVTGGVLGALVVIAAIGDQLRVANYDPLFMRTVVERVHAFGGTYYENAIHNKGPLEPFVYSMALHLGGRDGFWLVISVLAAVAGLVLAGTAAVTARSFGADRPVALAAATVVFVHMTLSGADYAGVLYARNITISLLAAAFAVLVACVVFVHRTGSARRTSAGAVAIGVLLGLAVQTLSTAAFAGAAVALGALVVLCRGLAPSARNRTAALLIGSGALTVASAPLYYAARGRFTEFWSGWWVHAHYMNEGTGRSLAAQFALGWKQFVDYYQRRPLAFLVVLAFAGLTRATWRAADVRMRALALALLGWFAGAWLELVLSQRYSSHYFSVTTAPTALMAAALAGAAVVVVRRSPNVRLSTASWPLAAAVLAIVLPGAGSFLDAAARTSRFTSPGAEAARNDRNQGGQERTARAVLDLVSEEGDAVLAWTSTSYPYLDNRRVSATRFIWKNFLVGEIYLGRTSPRYVLPHTWDWFREDLEESKPVAYVERKEVPPPDSPFTAVVQRDFALVYGDPHQRVLLRTAVAREVLTPAPAERSAVWQPAAGVSAAGWTVPAGGARYAGPAGGPALPVATGDCFRLDGTIRTDEAAAPAVLFQLDQATGGEQQRLTLDGDAAASGSPTAEYYRAPSLVGATDQGPVPFSVVVGRRAAVLVVRDRVVAAVRTTRPTTALSIVARRGSLTLADLRVGPAPSGSGCPVR